MTGAGPFERLAERYDAWFDEPEGRLIFASELAALRQLSRGLPRPWLEIGVGSGRFAQALGIDVGIDPSRRLLELARARGLKVILGRGEALPFSASSFGAVFLIVTICFVQDPLPVLKEAARVLKGGGSLVLGLVPRESVWGRHYLDQGRRGHPFYSLARFYTPGEIEGLLSQAGFRLRRCLSTLYQQPGEVTKVESPREGCDPRAGFLAILAGKTG